MRDFDPFQQGQEIDCETTFLLHGYMTYRTAWQVLSDWSAQEAKALHAVLRRSDVLGFVSRDQRYWVARRKQSENELLQRNDANAVGRPVAWKHVFAVIALGELQRAAEAEAAEHGGDAAAAYAWGDALLNATASAHWALAMHFDSDVRMQIPAIIEQTKNRAISTAKAEQAKGRNRRARMLAIREWESRKHLTRQDWAMSVETILRARPADFSDGKIPADLNRTLKRWLRDHLKSKASY